MKKLLLLMVASFCLLTVSCIKQADKPGTNVVQHSSAKAANDHSTTIDSANIWIKAYNDAHPDDTSNITLIMDKEEFQKLGSNPEASVYSMRIGLYQGHNTIVIAGWDASGQKVVSVDQHAFANCLRCGCCVVLAILEGGLLPL